MSGTTGVGILGCGPVTQAIHLPTLARLGGLFHVAAVMDTDPAVAESVAARCGARWTTDVDDLVADPAVEVVVVCSPNRFHADQVIAAFRAGARAVLCEKPLAETAEEARAIAAASEETGVPLVVGAMHTVNPAWRALAERIRPLVERARTIRSSIVLTPNPRSEDFASEIVGRPGPRPDPRSDVEIAADVMRGSIMGLAIHDLPLVRAHCPDHRDVEVLSALVPHPAGYLVDVRVGDRHVELYGVNNESWRPEWRFEAIGDDMALTLDFPPPYVHAGSGRSVLATPEGSAVREPSRANGYEEEWRLVAGIVAGVAEPPDLGGLVDDLVFAATIADGAVELVRASFATEGDMP